MAKWYGKIGYSETKETAPGVWTPAITERPYYGDVFRMSRRLTAGDSINDKLSISNQISIVADPYAFEAFSNMLYATFNGIKWKITVIEILYPRMTLTLGSEYVDVTSSDE